MKENNIERARQFADQDVAANGDPPRSGGGAPTENRVAGADDRPAKSAKLTKPLPVQALDLDQPEPWADPVDGAALLDALADSVREYVVMTDHEADAVALWVVLTHALAAFAISPRLAITSPEKRCGKTTLLDWLAIVTPRALSSANITSSATFRAIDDARPTLLIDEGDTFLHDRTELHGILNSGHRAGGFVVRTVGEGSNAQVRKFSTWGACAIALIGKLPDTLADRSIPIRLQRRRADEPVKSLRLDRVDPELVRLARQCARLAKDNIAALREAEPGMPTGLFNRAADNWRPILAIADRAGGDWPVKARAAARALTKPDAGDDDASRVELLADIRAAFDRAGADRILSKDLVEMLAGDPERPWSDWKNGKPITQRQLAGLLRPFHIVSETIRDGTKLGKGYYRARFEEAFGRYLALTPVLGPEQRYNTDDMGASEQPRSVTEDHMLRIERRGKSANGAACDGVTDQPQGGGVRNAGNGADGDGAGRVCAQCGADDGAAGVHHIAGQAVWLHRACVRLYREKQAWLGRDDGGSLDIPVFLDRRRT
jgi:hypothetical protein